MRFFTLPAALLFSVWVPMTAPAQDWTFQRGDCNSDGSLTLADAVYALQYSFGGTNAPQCLDACDLNDDGTLNLIDIMHQLHLQFGESVPPAPPFGQCGSDPTPDNLDCKGPLHTCPPSVNEAPRFLTEPVLTAAEGQMYFYDADAVDSAPTDNLTYSIVTGPLNAHIDPQSGLIFWNPNSDQTGERLFQVRVTDDAEEPLFAEQTFVVLVTDVNQPPVMPAMSMLMATEMQPFAHEVIAEDPDPNDQLAFELMNAPPGAEIDPATGNITWTPQPDQVGENYFMVRVSDDAAPPAMAEQPLLVMVIDVNQPPEIVSMGVTSAEEMVPYVYAVRAEDPDPGDTLTFSLDQSPAGATIDAANGVVLWTPQPSQEGTHLLMVRVTDDGAGNLSTTQTVMVAVGDTNQPPMFTSSPITTAREAELYTYDVDANDPDPMDQLTYHLANAPVGATINNTTGLVTWLPEPGQTGVHPFTIEAVDSGQEALSATQSFTVTVVNGNQPPVVVSVPSAQVTEGQLFVEGVVANDPDPDDVMTYSFLVAPEGASIDPRMGLIVWRPTAEQTGPNLFRVRITDNGARNLFVDAEFTINVVDTNQPPVIVSSPNTSATELQVYTYDVQGQDPDTGDSLTYTLPQSPTGASIDAATGLITWTPSSMQMNAQYFVVRVTDSADEFVEQSYTVTVVDRNQPPTIASNPPLQAAENQLYTYDVEANDPDPNDTLTYQLAIAPEHAAIDPLSGLIHWTPNALQTGNMLFLVRVTDNGVGALQTEQSFTVAVGDVDQPPVITSMPVTSATELMPYQYQVTAVDPDPDDELTFALTQAPDGATINATTGVISWIPQATQVGAQTFTVRVTSAAIGVAVQTFAVSVFDVNQPPMITSQPVTGATEMSPYQYAVVATDPDPGDTLTYQLLLSPAGATIDATTGVVQWAPDSNDGGQHPFHVRVFDSGSGPLVAEQSFTVNVAEFNRPPVITSTAPPQGMELVPYSYNVLVTDPDLSDRLTFELLQGPLGSSINAMTGHLLWTPGNGAAGNHDFLVRVTDSAMQPLSAQQAFTVEIVDANEAPEITSVPPLGATELSPYTYPVIATDADAGSVLQYSLIIAPNGATIDPTTGLVLWIPQADQVGGHPFQVRVTDDGSVPLTHEQTFTVTVSDINQPPQIYSPPVTVAVENAPYVYDVEANDPDPNDTLIYSLVEAPEGATIQGASGLILWTPTSLQTGIKTFTVRVTDNGAGGKFDDQAFSVTVTDMNQPPTITSTPGLRAMETEAYLYDIEATDPDPGDTFVFTLVAGPAGAQVDPGSGILAWTPGAGQTGSIQFRVRVADSGGLTGDQTFVVVVTDVNQPPVITSAPVSSGMETVDYVYDVEANDPDPNDTLVYSLINSPAGSTIDSGTGVITWTPGSMQVGPNTFTVRVTDALETVEQVFTVNVVDINQPPVVVSSPIPTAVEQEVYIYDVEAEDPDPQDTLTYALSLGPDGATIDTQTGIVMWTPSTNQIGLNHFTIRVTDNGAGNLSAAHFFSVTVGDVQHSPTITSQPITSVQERQVYLYDVQATDDDATDVLQYTLVTAPTGAAIDANSGLISWTPDSDQIGDNSFTVRVTDNSLQALSVDQSFIVTVIDINLPPVISSTPILVATESTPYTYDVQATDPDPTDALNFALAVAPPGAVIDRFTGLVTWTPSSMQTGDHVFTVRVTDNGAGNLFVDQIFTVNVGDISQAPTFTSTPPTTATEGSPFSYIATATDPDPDDDVRFSLVSGPAGATIHEITGVLVWTPGGDQTADQNFTLRVTDTSPSQLATEQSFVVSVTDMNQPPVFTSTAPASAEEASLYEFNLTAEDPDPTDVLTFSFVSGPAGVTVNASGLLQWTPGGSDTGSQSITVRVTDSGLGNLSADQTFVVVVSDVNQAPTIASTPPTVATEAVPYSYTVDGQDPDPGDTLSYILVDAPTHATIDSASGVLSWTPASDQVGTHIFLVSVSDGAQTAEQSFAVEVLNAQMAPVITSAPITTARERELYVYMVEAHDPDPSDTITFQLALAPMGASIDSTTGRILWMPGSAQVGDHSFTVRVTDDAALPRVTDQSFVVTVENVNQVPVILTTAPTTGTEQELYVYDVSATDADPGDTLTYTLEVAPEGATISAGSGLIVWTPQGHQTGSFGFTVRVTDDGDPVQFVEQTFSVAVGDVNQVPTITSTPPTTALEMELYIYNVTATDPDPSDSLTFSLTVAPMGATIDAMSGMLIWMPDGTQSGNNSFTVRATDDGAGGLFSEQSFNVLVTDINQAPVITSTPPANGVEMEIFAYAVEAFDPDGDALTFSLPVAPNGATIDAMTGTLLWTPPSNVGATFTVRVTDDGDGNNFVDQTFTITVTDVNQPPAITSTPVLSAEEVVVYNYDVDAQDPDGDTLSYSLTTAPAGATIDSTTGLITWTPNAGQSGLVPFTVRVTDDGNPVRFEDQLFIVEVGDVNQEPVITSVPPTTGTETLPFIYDVDALDPDSGDILTFSLETAPSGAIIDGANGLLVWSPSSLQVGSIQFVVRVTDNGDGMLFSEQSFAVQVADLNQEPTITSTPTTTAQEGQPYMHTVVAIDPDPTDVLTYTLDTSPPGATINPASGSIDWTPTTNQAGTHPFVVRVTDNGTGTLSTTQSFSVLVADVNQPPLVTTIAPPTAFVQQAYVYDVDATDSDGDRVTFGLTTAPLGATIDPDSGVLLWTPGMAQVGAFDFTVSVTDDGTPPATTLHSFSVQSGEVNFAPSFTSTPPTTAVEASQLTYDANATDANTSDVLTYTLQNAPMGAAIDSSSGVVTWTPSGSQVGTHAFAIRVTDNGIGMLFSDQAFMVTVSDVNQPPEITSTPVITATEAAPYTYTVVVTDPDPTDTIRFALLVAPSGASINVDTGVITWIPTANQTGDTVFQVRATDDGVGNYHDQQGFTVTVSDVNQAPTITSTPTTTATEGVAYSYLVTADDLDPMDTVYFSLSSSPAGMTIDQFTGLISWTPTLAQEGGHNVTVVATDTGSLTSVQNFSVAVGNVNQPPTIVSSANTMGIENVLYVYDVIATDPDSGDILTFSLQTAPTGATIDSSSGAIAWTPTALQTGLQSFVVRVTDSEGLLSEQPFTVNVTDVNQPPTITSVPILAASQMLAYTYTVTATDPDPADSPTFQLLVSPQGASIDSLSGLIQWTPSETQIGPHDFRVRAADAGGAGDEQLFIVVVAPESNVAPEITSAPPLSASMNVALSYTVTSTDPNVDDTVTYSLQEGPGSATIDPLNGQLTWLPNGIGLHSFVVRATDDGNLFTEQEFTVDVRYRINCGELTDIFVDTDGNSWATDFGFDNPVNERYAVSDPIAGTDNDKIYQSERYTLSQARLGYSLPTLPRDVTIVLHFAETTFVAPGVRVFDIEIEGVVMAPNYDILDPAHGGAPLTAMTETFDVTINDSSIDIVFIDLPQDAPKISAIEVLGHEALQVAPVITSTPGMVAMEAQLFSYDVDAVDGNPGDSITYSIVTGPMGAIIDPISGLLEWTPGMGSAGMTTFTVRATDTTSMSTLQTFELQVLSENNLAPAFTSTPLTTKTSVTLTWEYTAIAVDPNPGTMLLYSLVTAPPGATINPTTGEIAWTPVGTDLGLNNFVVRVSDQNPMGALTATQNFAVDVGYRINCGELTTVFVDPQGDPWAPDFGFDANSSVFERAVTIAGTNRPTLYHSERYTFAAQMNYVLAVTPGAYTVSLFFSENHWTDVGNRRFDIFVTGEELLNFDILAEVPRRTAHIENFSVATSGNSLQIVLSQIAGADAPKLCAIAIQRDGDANTPPSIDSTAPTTATATQIYRYDVAASDVDSNPLTFSLLTAPTGATIGANDGGIEWTPGISDIGTHAFTVQVADNAGGTALQNFDLVVSGIPNDPPTIGSMAPTSATANVQLVYDVEASDTDGDDLTFSIQSGPAGATIDPTTGLLEWTPTGADLGIQVIVVRVTDDGFGAAFADQLISVDVRYRINCGQSGLVYTDEFGNSWSPDFGFDPATSADFTIAAEIANTEDDVLYHSERYTLQPQTTYSLPVSGNGMYGVRIYFAETFWGPGGRIFDLTIEGSAALTNYDIATVAGGNFTAIDEFFNVSVIGNLDITLVRGLADAPKISAIEVFVAP
ncbi:MAG: putative Ig domain-containing protein [Planctomycetota bacterium]